MQKLSRMLHRYPERAALVKTLAFTVGDKISRYVWGSLCIPFQPNCTEIHIIPGEFVEHGKPQAIMPFAEILCWAANCPNLTLLRLQGIVNGTFRTADDEYNDDNPYYEEDPMPTIENLNLDLPRSLKTLRINDIPYKWWDQYSDNISPIMMDHFWSLCSPWVENLLIDGDYNHFDRLWFQGAEAIGPHLKHLRLHGDEDYPAPFWVAYTPTSHHCFRAWIFWICRFRWGNLTILSRVCAL